MHPVWLQRRTGTIQWKTFEIELSLQSHALFCRHQSPEPRKQRLRRPLEPHVTRKKHRVSRPKVFSPREFTRSRTVALPNYLMRGGWHDDVLDMMVWMLSMTIVRNSDAFKLYKLPLINSPNQPHVCHFPKKSWPCFLRYWQWSSPPRSQSYGCAPTVDPDWEESCHGWAGRT